MNRTKEEVRRSLKTMGLRQATLIRDLNLTNLQIDLDYKQLKSFN